MLQGGQALLDKVTANSIGLRDKVTAYAPILLTAEDAINGSVRIDDEQIRAETLGLSRAIGARGQMLMQQLLVNLGDQIPEPELRTSMITLAGTEPSTLFGMSQVVGVGSPDAEKLQSEMVNRMALMSDPTVPLVNNPDLTQSLQATNQIAGQVIDSTTKAVTTGVDDQAAAKRTEAIRDSVIVGVAILIALLIVTLVARTLVRPLRKLRDGALRVAHEDLALELERARTGGPADPVQPLPVYTTEEVGQVAHAVDELHEQAVLLAGEQARLQLQVGDMFETLSRRSRSLVDQQLTLIDRLERNEEDPERLDSLFKLDHLAARMRRNGANLLVLAGSKVPREQAAAVPVAAVIDAAASEVEDYTRVVTAVAPDSEILGVVAGDLVHLLAELLDNALRYSPPISQVRVSAMHTGNGGLVIEASDVGLGMTESDLRVANTRLQSGGEVNPYTARHMGLFVVGRLAAQHGLVVRLRSTVARDPNSGTTAGVYIPAELLLRGSAPLPNDAPDYGVPDVGPGEFRDRRRSSKRSTSRSSGIEPPPVGRVPQRPRRRSGFASAATQSGCQRHLGHSVGADRACARARIGLAGGRVAGRLDARADAVSRPGAGSSSADPGARGAACPGPDEHLGVLRRAGAGSRPAGQRRLPACGAAPPPPPEHVRPEAAAPSPTAGSDDAIFQKMLSEWLIDDPTELAQSTDLDWKTVWDSGWEAAAAADEAPVAQHTEHGLPMREPGARLVPGAAEGQDDGHNGRHRNGGTNGSNGDQRCPGARRRRPARACRRAIRRPSAPASAITSEACTRAAPTHEKTEEQKTNDPFDPARIPRLAGVQVRQRSSRGFARDPGVRRRAADGRQRAHADRAGRSAGRGGVGAGEPVHRRRATLRRRVRDAVRRRDGERLPAAHARRRRVQPRHPGHQVLRHRPDRL